MIARRVVARLGRRLVFATPWSEELTEEAAEAIRVRHERVFPEWRVVVEIMTLERGRS